MDQLDRMIAIGVQAMRAKSKTAIAANGQTVQATIGASQLSYISEPSGTLRQCVGMVALTAAEVTTLGLDFGVPFTVAGEAMRVYDMAPDGAGNTDVHYRKARE